MKTRTLSRKKKTTRRTATGPALNNPIVTVKLLSVTQSGNIGSDPDLTIQVNDGPVATKISVRKPEIRWLYQAPVGLGSVTACIRIAVGEKDAHKELSPIYRSLKIDLSPPDLSNNYEPRSDILPDSVEVVVPDTKKSAIFKFRYYWFVTASARDVAKFIIDRLRDNLVSSSFKSMVEDLKKIPESDRRDRALMLRRAVEAQSPSGSTNAYATLTSLVYTDLPWDKVEILNPPRQGVGGRGVGFGRRSFDPETGKLYDHDIWANIHFGLVGAAAQFNEDDLLNGPGDFLILLKLLKGEIDPFTAAKTVATKEGRNIDQAADQAAIKLGVRLWHTFGKELTIEELIEAIRKDSALHKAPAPLPEVAPQEFLNKLE